MENWDGVADFDSLFNLAPENAVDNTTTTNQGAILSSNNTVVVQNFTATPSTVAIPAAYGLVTQPYAVPDAVSSINPDTVTTYADADDKDYLCGICGETYRGETPYRQHMRRHEVGNTATTTTTTTIANATTNGLDTNALLQMAAQEAGIFPQASDGGTIEIAQGSNSFQVAMGTNVETGAVPYDVLSYEEPGDDQVHVHLYANQGGDEEEEVEQQVPEVMTPNLGGQVIGQLSISTMTQKPGRKKGAVKGKQGVSGAYLSNMDQAIRSEGGKHYCRVCGKCFARVDALKDHITTHTGVKPFNCHRCGAGFRRRAQLASHVLTCTCETSGGSQTEEEEEGSQVTAEGSEVKVYRCVTTQCSEKFTQASALADHMKVCIAQACRQSADSYKEYFALAEAACVKVGAQFQCSHCSKVFDRRDVHRDHVIQHTGVFPFNCDQCKRGFTRKSALAGHKCKGPRASPDTKQDKTAAKPAKKRGPKSKPKPVAEETVATGHEPAEEGLVVSDEQYRKTALIEGVDHELCEPEIERFERYKELGDTGLDCKTNLHYCKLCSFTDFDVTKARLHVTFHTHYYPYQCLGCKRDFNGAAGYIQHVNKCGHYKAERLNIRAGEKETKKLMADVISAIPAGACARFVTSVREGVSAVAGKLRCKLCAEESAEKRVILEHVTTHTNIFPFHCDACQAGFFTRVLLVEHESTCVEEEVLPNSITPGKTRRPEMQSGGGAWFATCPCKLQFHTKEELRDHYATCASHQRKLQKDAIADSVKQMSFNIVRDMIQTTPTPTTNFDGLSCANCSAAFGSIDSLRDHLATCSVNLTDPDSAANALTCANCDAQCETLAELKKHLVFCTMTSAPKTPATLIPTTTNSSVPLVVKNGTKPAAANQRVSQDVDSILRPLRGLDVLEVLKALQGLADELHLAEDEVYRVSPVYLASVQALVDALSPSDYECKICTSRYATSTVMNDHVTTHTNIYPFNCPWCRFGFNRKTALRQHVKKCEWIPDSLDPDDNLYSPSKDNKKAAPQARKATPQAAKQPKKKAAVAKAAAGEAMTSPSNPMASPSGNHSFSEEDIGGACEAFLDMVQENQYRKPGIYGCKLCNKEWPRGDQLKDHLTLTHTKIYPYYCPNCKGPFLRKYKLRAHLPSCSGQPLTGTAGKTTPKSNKKAKRKSVADDVIIPPENVVTFADVHATFADVHATENNVTIAHDDAPAPLDDVVEHDDDDVVEVVAAATPNDGQKTENAPGAAMSDDTNLFDISEKYLESIKEWTGCRGTKMFCKFCNGYFPLVTELNEHITTHTGVFPFNCSQCNRGFNRTGELAGHINLCKTEEVISSKVSPKVSKGGVTIVREYEEKQETQQEGDLSMEVTCESFDVFPAYAGPVDDDVESAFNDVTVVHPSTSAKPSGRGRGKVKGRGGGRAGPKSKTAQKSAPPSGDDVVMFTDSEGDDVDGDGYYPSGDEDSNAAAGASTTQLFENIFDKVISKPAASDTKSPKRLQTSAGYGATLNDYVKKYGNKLICKGCNKKFKNYRDIAEHVPSHTGIYPYTCGYCARGFTREKLLTEHLVKCTGEEEAAPPGGGRQGKLSPGSKGLLKDCHARGDAQISLAPVDRFSPGGARRKRGVESPPHPASASKRGRLADNPGTKSPATSSLLVPPTDGALGYSAAFIESAKNAYRFENGKYVCVTCGKEYSKEALVLGHVHTHTDILPYDCPLCPLSFSVKSKAEGHIKYCKSRADRAAKAGASPAAAAASPARAPPVFKSPTAAAKLTSPAPPAAPPAVVEIDEASITVSDAYLKSIDDGINFQDGELCCRYCEEPFDSLKLLREHIPTHTGITPYSCPACQIKFLNKEPLLRHMRKCVAASSPGVTTTPTSRGVTSQPTAADYSEPEVEDSVDEVVYDAIEVVQEPVDETQIVVSEKYLDSMKVNIKHFRGQNHCAICNMKFKQIRDLREHITSHTGILPFNCPHCETGFNRKSKIAEHIPQCRAKQQAAKVAPKPKAGPKSSKAQAGPKSSKAKAGPKSSKAPVISEPPAPRATRRSLVSAPEVDMTSPRASRRASATPSELQDTPRASRRAAAATPIEKNDTPRAAKRAAATFIEDLESPRASRRSSLPTPAKSTTRQVATPAAAKPGPASSKSKSKAKAPSLETKNEAAGYDYSTTVSEEFMQAFWKQVKIKDGVYVCKCGRRASLANMRDHVMMHITLKPYNCFRCPMSFRRLPQIQKHLLTCGGEEGDNSQSDAELPPPAKKQKAAPKSEVISPKKSSRVSESPQKKAAATKECEDSPSGQIALSKDYLASIKKNTMSKGGKLSCKICRKSFRHQGSLNDHVISHTGIKPFSCPKCNAGYMTKGKLVTHIKSCAIKSVLRFSAKAKTSVKSKPGPASSKKGKAAPESSKKPKPEPASSKKPKPEPASSKKSKPGPASSKKSKPGPASSKKSIKSPLHKIQKSKVQKPAPKSKKLKLTKRSKELLKMCDQKLMKVKVEMDKAYEEAHEYGLGREATEEERAAITKRVVVLKLTRIPEKDLPKYDDDKKADTATDLDTTLPDVGSGADDRGSQTEDSAFSDSSSRPDGDAADGKRRRRKKRGTGEVKDLRKMLTLLSVSDQAKVEEEEAGGGLYSDGPCLDDPTFKPDVDGEAENKVAETETKEDDKDEDAELLTEGDEIKTAVENTGVNEAEKMEVSDDKDQESEATTENQTVENETEAPKEKNAEADPEHSKMDAEDEAQLEKAEDSGDVTESKMSEQGDDDFIVPESPSRDAEVTSPIPLPDNAVESEPENDDHGETTTAVTEPELTEDDDQEENVKEGDEEERGVVKGGDEEPEDNKPEAPAAADEEEKEDVSPEPKSTGEDEDEINDGEVKRGTPVFCEEDRSPGTPAARSSASQGSSPVSHEKMDGCPASPSEGPSPAPESRSPSPAGQKKTSRSPSPTGQEKTSRSPSPTGQEKTSRSPSPTGQEKTSGSPSPTGQEKTSRSPSPTGEEKTSRSPSPTGEEKSSRSPSPTGQEKSSRSPSPIGQEKTSRSPSPTGEERASRSPSPTGEEPSPNSPSPTGEKSAFPAPGEELSPAPAEPTDDAERCMDGVTEAETPTYTTVQDTGTTTEQNTDTTAEQNAESDNEVPGGFFNSLVPYGTEDESSAAEDEEQPKEATPSGGDMWEDALAPVRHRKRTLSECNEGSEVEGQGSEVATDREIV